MNAEYNQLANAFDNTNGHDHSGSVAGDAARIPLGSAVSGVLPVANGGTGTSSGSGGPFLPLSGGTLTGGLNANGGLNVTGGLQVVTGALQVDAGNLTVSGAGSVGSGFTVSSGNLVVTSGAVSAVSATLSGAGGPGTGALVCANGGVAATQFSSVPPSGTDALLYMFGNQTGGGHEWSLGTKVVSNLGEFWIYDNTQAALRIEIGAGGACSAATTWAVISDAAVKSDVVDHPHGLREILALQPRRFKYNGEHGLEGEGSGLVAQELEAVMPELVREMTVGEDGTTVKTVLETGVIWPLINAVKELKWEIEQLKAKVGG